VSIHVLGHQNLFQNGQAIPDEKKQENGIIGIPSQHNTRNQKA